MNRYFSKEETYIWHKHMKRSLEWLHNTVNVPKIFKDLFILDMHTGEGQRDRGNL